jgi:hypothetical protein
VPPLSPKDRERQAELQRELAAAQARIEMLERENRALVERLGQIAALAAVSSSTNVVPVTKPRQRIQPILAQAAVVAPARGNTAEIADNGLHPAARKLLMAAAQHAPARFTWGQLATLAGLKPSGGHFNAGRQVLRTAGYVAEVDNLVTATAEGLKAAGEVPPAPSTAAERLALWCGRLPSPAPEILRALAVQGERYVETDELAAALGKKPTGGHWNSGIAVLRNNGLIDLEPVPGTAGGRRYRITALFRE